MREFSVLVFKAPDVPGQWISHCLTWDVISMGDSPRQAMESLIQAIVMVIEEDLKAGLDPSGRPPAPPECWQPFFHVQNDGKQVDESQLDKSDANITIAGTLRMQELGAPAQKAAAAPRRPQSVPPPWMISALSDRNGDGGGVGYQ